MAKKNGFHPYVMLSGGLTPGGGEVTGGGTGEGMSDPFPMSYSEWLTSGLQEDIVGDDGIDEVDYAAWWEANGFPQDAWEELNPGLAWEDYFP